MCPQTLENKEEKLLFPKQTKSKKKKRTPRSRDKKMQSRQKKDVWTRGRREHKKRRKTKVKREIE